MDSPSEDLLEHNCDSSSKSNLSSEVCEPESDNQSQDGDNLNESDKDGNGESSTDLLESESEKPAEENNHEEWSEDSEEEEEDESEDEEEVLNESVIDELLEQGLPESKRLEKPSIAPAVKVKAPIKLNEKGPGKSKAGNNEPTIKRITILDEKDENAFEVLPGDWIKVRHSSGLPLYLHRPTRVCTLAKPYYLGPASVRRHSVPLSAIPCLAYRRGLEKEQKDKQLLEQAKEMEKEKSPEDDGSSALASLECPMDTNEVANAKVSSLATELGVEKVNLLKRKIMQKELNGRTKRGKLNSSCSSSANVIVKPESTQHTCNKNSDSSNQTNEPLNGEPKETPEVPFNRLSPAARKHLKKTEIPAVQQKLWKKECDTDSIPGLKTLLPLAKVETAKENASLYSVPPLELREYCKLLFQFNVVECKRFKTWSARRLHSKEQKRRQLERPTLPDNAQVIKFFDISDGNFGRIMQKLRRNKTAEISNECL